MQTVQSLVGMGLAASFSAARTAKTQICSPPQRCRIARALCRPGSEITAHFGRRFNTCPTLKLGGYVWPLKGKPRRNRFKLRWSWGNFDLWDPFPVSLLPLEDKINEPGYRWIPHNEFHCLVGGWFLRLPSTGKCTRAAPPGVLGLSLKRSQCLFGVTECAARAIYQLTCNGSHARSLAATPLSLINLLKHQQTKPFADC